MRKSMYLRMMAILSVCGALAVFSSCTDDSTKGDNVKPDSKNEIKVTGTAKAIASADGTLTVQPAWKADDRIGVYYVPQGGETTGFANAEFKPASLNADKREAVFNSVAGNAVWDKTATTHKLYAVYPYNSTNSDMTVVKVNLPVSYTAAGESVDNLLMVGRAETEKSVESVKMDFSSPLAFVKLNFDATGTALNGETMSSVKITSDTEIAGNAVYNLQTGALSGFDSKEITFDYSGGIEVTDDMSLYFAVNPDVQSSSAKWTLNMEGDMIKAEFDVNLSTLSAGGVTVVDIDAAKEIASGNGHVDIEGTIDANLSNSYMITPGGRIIIPVKQAYKAWDEYMGKPLAAQPELSCKLLWTDVKGGLSNEAALSTISMFNATEGENAGIYVKAGKAEGNALVALYADGNLVWSWHIWVTNYDPSVASGQRIIGGRTLMDRNIGALNTTQGDIGSHGLAYEWGRKDPFPCSNNELQPSTDIRNEYRTIYDANGEVLSCGQGGIGIDIGEPQYPDELDGIAYAVENPTLYIKALDGGQYGSQTNRFWTTNRLDINRPNTLRNDMWGDKSGVKAIFDPCPVGWKVPSSNDIAQALNERGAELIPTYGVDFGDYGYFPFEGQIEVDGDNGGYWVQAGYCSSVWLSMAGGFGGQTIEFSRTNPTPEALSSAFRAYGHSVRCERE